MTTTDQDQRANEEAVGRLERQVAELAAKVDRITEMVERFIELTAMEASR